MIDREGVITQLIDAGVVQEDGCGLLLAAGLASEVIDAAMAVAQKAMVGELERICAAIKAEDDYCIYEGDYMLDSDDCINVARGQWVRPDYSIRNRGIGGGE